jgi:hypothetical protein
MNLATVVNGWTLTRSIAAVLVVLVAAWIGWVSTNIIQINANRYTAEQGARLDERIDLLSQDRAVALQVRSDMTLQLLDIKDSIKEIRQQQQTGFNNIQERIRQVEIRMGAR